MLLPILHPGRPFFTVARLLVLTTLVLPCSAEQPPVVLYEFGGTGALVQDTSVMGKPVHLSIGKPKLVRRQSGVIQLQGKTSVATQSKPDKPSRSIKKSGQMTIEVWLTPGNLTQAGPARIVTLSTDTSNRNFTLGQDKDRIDVRLRTTKTDKNGLPSLASAKKSLRKSLTHVVFTRARDGKTRLFLDGKKAAEGAAKGDFSNWDGNARLAIGDEVSGGRGWTGKLHRVAIYDHAHSESDVRRHFQRGLETAPRNKPPSKESLAAAHFQRKIAPLLSKHCLECHDITSAKGDLVLDRKETAFDDAIIPGDSENSPLWISVEDDTMPHNRAPLTGEEKGLLKKWIDDGASWSLTRIDPADYLNDAEKSESYIRRLTVDEYIRSVQVAVDVDIAYQAKKRLPPDLRADGFSNTAYNLTIDLGHVEAYNRLAKQIVAQMDPPAFAKRFWGTPKLTDNDMRGLIQKMGTWILRGPLDDREIVFYRGISTTAAAAGGDYGDAVGATIQAMLQSPRFLYRIENQNADGSTDYIDDYQLASRISYILWGSPPDSKLMEAASDGELSDPEVVAQHVSRMMEDDRAIVRSKDFLSQWLNLDHLRSLSPDSKRFPNWDDRLAAQMREETLTFFEHVAWKKKQPLSKLLDAQVTFCSAELAKHYSMEPTGTGIQEYDLSDVPERGGLLTQGSLLTIGGDDASMVTRGLFVLNQLLRGVVNDPPPCVDTTPVPTKAGVTARTIAQARLDNEACGGCHVRFEPLAFGLEKYDGLGAFHDKDEYKNDLREDGNVLIPGTADAIEFKNSKQLMNLLASSDRVQETLVWKLAQFAIGRPLTANDSETIRKIHAKSKEKGGTYQAILTEITISPLVNPSSL
jgi:hypothetical protein